MTQTNLSVFIGIQLMHETMIILKKPEKNDRIHSVKE
jgi:hypothetical protein